MDGPQALLVGGPYDGTVVVLLLPQVDHLLVETHLYESVDHWTEHRGARVRVFVHQEDCCDAPGDKDIYE